MPLWLCPALLVALLVFAVAMWRNLSKWLAKHDDKLTAIANAVGTVTKIVK